MPYDVCSLTNGSGDFAVCFELSVAEADLEGERKPVSKEECVCLALRLSSERILVGKEMHLQHSCR